MQRSRAGGLTFTTPASWSLQTTRIALGVAA